MSDTIETILSTDQNFRARIIQTDDAHMPDGCWFGTVYSLYGSGSAEILAQDGCVRSDLTGELAMAWSLFHDMEDVEKAMRGEINHCAYCYETLTPSTHYLDTWVDAKKRVKCNDGEYDLHEPSFDHTPVVGFDYLDRSDYKMVNVVTLADLKHWGFASLTAYRDANPDKDPSAGNLIRWEAWADGDTYYAVVERKVAVHTEITTLDGDEVIQPRTTSEQWDEIDSLHGFYGADQAEVGAKELLESYESDGVPA